MNTTDFATQPTARFLKVVDSTLAPGQQIISWGKWHVPIVENDGGVIGGGDDADNLPQWHGGGDAELAYEFFGELARRREKIMAGRPHCYLEIVATLPKHQGESPLDEHDFLACSTADSEANRSIIQVGAPRI